MGDRPHFRGFEENNVKQILEPRLKNFDLERVSLLVRIPGCRQHNPL